MKGFEFVDGDVALTADVSSDGSVNIASSDLSGVHLSGSSLDGLIEWLKAAAQRRDDRNMPEAETVEGRLADLMAEGEVRIDGHRLSDDDKARVICALHLVASDVAAARKEMDDLTGTNNVIRGQ